MNCTTVRDELATHATTDDPAVLAHLAHCAACESYRRSHISLDTLLRAELRWEAPAALTARLLSIAATAPLVPTVPLARPQPKQWYVTLVYVLTALAVAVSLMVAWQFVGGLAGQMGVDGAVAWVLAAPGRAMQALVQVLPESQVVLAFFLDARDKLLWLLLAAVVWAVLDKWNPQISIGRRQQQA